MVLNSSIIYLAQIAIRNGMKKIILITFILLFRLPAASQQTTGDQYFQDGKDWLDKGSNEKAIASFLESRRAYLKEQNFNRYFVATQALSTMYDELAEGVQSEKIILEAIGTIPKQNTDQRELHAKLQDNLAYTYLNVLNQAEKAIEAYTQSINFYASIGKANSKETAFELTNRSLVHQQLSHYPQAVDDLLRAIAINEKDTDVQPQDIAESYYTLGMSYTELEEFEKALNSLKRGLTLIGTLEKSETLGRFYNAIGNAYKTQHKYQLAIENYVLSKDIYESVFGKDAENYCQPLINIGDANKSMGDWKTALLNYQDVLTIYQKTPPKDLGSVVYLFLEIAKTMNGLGLTEKSNEVVGLALTFAGNAIGKNSVEEAEIYKHMAVVAYNDGECDKSLTFNFKAISILESSNYPKNGYYAELYDAIGQAYDALDETPLALKYKQQAKVIYETVYGSINSAVAMEMGSMGLSYEIANQSDEALELLNQSATILLQSPESNKKELGITYADIGRNFLIKKEPKKAIECLEKARVIFDADNKSFNKAKVYNELGAAYSLVNNLAKAAECFQKAIIANTFNFENMSLQSNPDKQNYVNYYELATSFISKADLYRLKDDKASLLKGIQQLDAADILIKKTANQFSSPADRLKLSKLNSFFTEAGMQLADKLYQLTKDPTFIEKAFYFSERSKANELFNDIQLSKAKSLSKIPTAILARKKEVEVKMNSLNQQLASAYSEQNQSLITKLKTEEFELRKEQLTIQTKMDELSPKLSSINNKRALPTWRDIKTRLDPNTVVVSYSITDSAKYVLVGNSNGLILKRISNNVNIEKLIKGYVNKLKFNELSYKQIAARLTDVLWMPVEDAIKELGVKKIDKIVVIPEGSLNYLPFESLGKDQFLIEKYNMHYSYSAALLLNVIKDVPNKKYSFIAMAPVFEDKETNFVNKSCERFVKYSKKVDTTSRAFSLNGDYITPLPGTRTEVEKINQIHIEKGLLSKFFVEEGASEELIKKGELEKFDFIHLATHGFVNSQYPELSGLLLTQNAKSVEDGVLYTGEILGLNFNAQLVTLSACETALGKKVEGEGVRGLATAFLFAGAKNVIASLWKVSDASTSELMIEFYTELLSGKDKATALRLAKLKLIKSDGFNTPYYWAPFVQVGAN